MISLSGVTRTYAAGGESSPALRDVTLRVARGEWVALVGPSGSGKSTLLNLIAGLDRPSAGRIVIGDVDLGRLDEEALARWRAPNVGIVFQFFQLLPTLTALENVALPMEFVGRRNGRRERAGALLDRVGVGHRRDHLPGSLSGGEQQRVAIARALANDPPLLIADEPTGNLDAASGEAIVGLLVGYWRSGGTLVLVTHDAALAAQAPGVVTIRDGALVGDATAAVAGARHGD